MAGKRKTGSALARVGHRVKRAASSSLAAGASASVSAASYKLLALDLDGTLLNHAGVANDTDVAAIRKLKARGIKVTILTGRLYSGTRESAELLGIDGPVGCADGSHIVNSTEALAFERVPQHLIVVGAGYIGLELGSVWSRLGAKVTVVEFLPRVLPLGDAEIAEQLVAIHNRAKQRSVGGGRCRSATPGHCGNSKNFPGAA